MVVYDLKLMILNYNDSIRGCLNPPIIMVVGSISHYSFHCAPFFCELPVFSDTLVYKPRQL